MRGRFVFSSSEDPTRAIGTGIAAKESSLVSSLVSSVNNIAESLFATLFPSDCRICGAPLTNISRLPVCEECLSDMRPIAGGTCSVCGERLMSPYAFSGDNGEPRCGLCRRVEPAFVRAVAYGSYDGGLRELIHLLKYEQVRPAAQVLGRMLSEVMADLQPEFADVPVIVVPVPLHAGKLRQRGFNQSELITRAALKQLSAGRKMVLNADVLNRRRETQSQIGLTRHQRRENVRGAFSVARPEDIGGHEVLLVDDVFTTGTTVSECARILRKAGATKVWVATVARTLKLEAAHVEFDAEADARMTMAAAG